MYIKATLCRAWELKPGDLFSKAGPSYWIDVDHRQSIGESVYVRTNTPAEITNDFDSRVFKIEIIKDGEENTRATA